MIQKLGLSALAIAMLAGCAEPNSAELADVFGDHMVIQRDQPVRVFGTGEPGTELSVKLDAAVRTVTVAESGAWQVEFAALPAGGIHEISLHEGGRKLDHVGDVLSGDVFLCSGQSNMKYPLRNMPYAPQILEEASEENIRLLNIYQKAALEPQSKLPEPTAWSKATPEAAEWFSAMCYFTGRDIAETYDVPVGLIQSAWGGSRIESWIDAEVAGAAAEHAEQVELLRTHVDDPVRAAKDYSESWQASWLADPATGGDAVWDAPDKGDWAAVPGQLRDWRTWGDPELADHKGMVWHKVSFDLTEAQASQTASVHIGSIDDTDVTWMNGVAIGTTFDWGGLRVYDVPADLLRAGRNVLLVNAHNDYGEGGMNGPDAELRLELADGSSVSLAEGWTYRKVPTDVTRPKPAPWQTIQGYSMLHNAMIAPLEGVGLKGAIWYQGESNAGAGAAYEELLTLLVQDWRAKFGADLPVVVVQLPRFGALPTVAGEPGWGMVRESMRRVAAQDDRVGLAVTIDLGDPYDIHPADKISASNRVIRVAKALIYGEAIDGPSGPVATDAEILADEIRVSFQGIDQGLVTISSSNVTGVELCDGAACRFAPATLDGDVMIIETDGAQVSEIRYCQGDSPLCNLFDGNGLPAGPFWMQID